MTTKTILRQLATIPLLLLLGAGVAWAEVPPPKPDLTPLYEQWQLDEGQIAELETYFQQIHEARTALRAQNFESRQERRAAMRSLRETHRDNIKNVLSEAQMEDLKAYMRQFGHRRGGKKWKGKAEQVEG